MVELFLFWVGITVAIGFLARRYGRIWLGWCFLSIVLSPVVAGAILLAVGPRSPANRQAIAPTKKASRAFRCDGVFDGLPYQVTPDNEIDVLTAHGIVRFRSLDDFRASAALLAQPAQEEPAAR